MAETFERIAPLLIVDPNRISLLANQFGQRLAQHDFAGGRLRHEQFGLQVSVVADPEESGHRGVGPVDEQFQGGPHALVGLVAAQQFDAELVQQQQLLGLARVGNRRQPAKRHHVGLADRLVLEQRLRDAGAGLSQRGGRLRLTETELGGAQANQMSLAQHRVIDLLIVDERAVATVSVADFPGLILEGHHRVNPGTKRIGQDDGALETAADAVLVLGVEHVTRARATPRRHREIGVHRLARAWT